MRIEFPEQEVRKNKAKFIEEYDIHKIAPESIQVYDDDNMFDHTIIYITKAKKIVIVTSPYSKKAGLLLLGFKLIYPLYRTNAFTYVCVLNTKQDLYKLNLQCVALYGNCKFEVFQGKVHWTKMPSWSNYMFYMYSLGRMTHEFKQHFGCGKRTFIPKLYYEHKKYHNAIRTLQRAMRKAMYDPNYELCKRIMKRKFDEASQPTKK